jgi:hypothetical protein
MVKMRRIYGKPQAMKTARHIRAVRCLFASIIVAFVEGFATAADDAEPVVTEAAVREAEAEAKALQRQLSELQDKNRVLAKRAMVLNTTADLISGRRDQPPVLQVVEHKVCSLGENPVTLDNRANGEPQVWKKWLSIEDGRRYRVRAKIEIQEISETKNFKFGMMVSAPGRKTDWPAAFIGGKPFKEKEVAFDFFCPQGGSCLFIIGFESGKGVATFRDVTVYELKEELK